jgi:pimeloyl-ACP methyl ester carboxylesterase
MGADLLGAFDVPAHLPAAGSAFEIVDGVGHFLHLEQPELIAAKIGDWLGA